MEPRGSLGEALGAILCYGKRRISVRKPHILKPEGIGGIWEGPRGSPGDQLGGPGILRDSPSGPQGRPRERPGETLRATFGVPVVGTPWGAIGVESLWRFGGALGVTWRS